MRTNLIVPVAISVLVFLSAGNAWPQKSKSKKAASGIMINIGNAEFVNDSVLIPISLQTEESIVSLDFNSKINQTKLAFGYVTEAAPYVSLAIGNFTSDDQRLYFTSFAKVDQPYESGTVVAKLKFAVASDEVTSLDFSDYQGYLNGEPADMIINEERVSDLRSHYSKPAVSIYPNPAADIVYVKAEGLSIVQLTDMNVRVLRSMKVTPGNPGTLPVMLTGLANGAYTMRVMNNGQLSDHRLIIRKNP